MNAILCTWIAACVLYVAWVILVTLIGTFGAMLVLSFPMGFAAFILLAAAVS